MHSTAKSNIPLYTNIVDKRTLHIAALFLALLAAQTLICNHILLFGVAVPLVMVYFIVRMPVSMNISLLLTLSFLLGLGVDIFSDTPGLNALACTLTAAVRRPVLYAYVQHDDRMKEIIPNIITLGLPVYCKYLLTLVGIFSFLVFSIEYLSFADFKEVALLTVGSSLLTFLLLLGIDSLVTVRRDKR